MQALFFMSKALSISSLKYSIAGFEILKNLNLEVSEHQYFAIAGVNGAGKSTLIKLILDLIRPSNDSQIEIYGCTNRNEQSQNRLTYLPEKFDIRKTVTGWQYLKFVASIYGFQINIASIEALAKKLDFLPNRLDSKVASYSKGMVQKLGLISCFMLERDFLILDEPLSGLDPKARYHFKQLLLEEKAEGRTVLYSTHMLADAEEICDRFGILHQGEMKFIGSPQSCLQTFEAETLEQAYMKCISTG